MDLVMLVLVAVFIGFLVWLLTTKIEMPPLWARVIQVLALIGIIFYLLPRIIRIPNVLH